MMVNKGNHPQMALIQVSEWIQFMQSGGWCFFLMLFRFTWCSFDCQCRGVETIKRHGILVVGLIKASSCCSTVCNSHLHPYLGIAFSADSTRVDWTIEFGNKQYPLLSLIFDVHENWDFLYMIREVCKILQPWPIHCFEALGIPTWRFWEQSRSDPRSTSFQDITLW